MACFVNRMTYLGSYEIRKTKSGQPHLNFALQKQMVVKPKLSQYSRIKIQEKLMDSISYLRKAQLLFDKHFTECVHPMLESVRYLLICSEYARRKVGHLKNLLENDACNARLNKKQYAALAEQLPTSNQQQFMAALRTLRHQQLLRLMLREYAGLAATQETLTCWSDCADVLILSTMAFCQSQLTLRFGVPRDALGNPASLHAVAMGKLGGQELNFSSDIDLIFIYTRNGQTDGERSLSNEEYFTRLVQMFVQIMQTVTDDGFVFRVDLRLRPNGESGALVSSLAQVETYYQEQGRDWERYAMVKARVICPDSEPAPQWFDQWNIPFVYRRYVDFSVLDSLRGMKALIEREIQLNPRLDDIKRGLGGIREIEFIIQNIQLIRGGRLPQIRRKNALAGLKALAHEGLLADSGRLKKAYLFLRRLENCLQGANDQQTHQLPVAVEQQQQLLLAMGFSGWQELTDTLHQHQQTVSKLFQQALKRQDAGDDFRVLLQKQLLSLWQGHLEETMAVNLLQTLGYHEPQRCYQMIHTFRHSSRCRRLSQSARLRLDQFMWLFLHELSHVHQTETVLLQMLHLLENIVNRSPYLALLTENPNALKELLRISALSPYIAELLVCYPFLLEALLEVTKTAGLPSRSELKQTLSRQLRLYKDVDEYEDVLRQFKLTYWLLAARTAVDMKVSACRVGRFLSDVAQVIVEQVVNLAFKELQRRYPNILAIKRHFAVLAYGKLGSQEMNFGSDLDLVFVHTATASEEALVNRLSQKILHMLTARSQFGILYTVDTRLRPSGSAGLLVSHLGSFKEYQQNEAWTWEHQALIRARVIVGGIPFRHALNEIKSIVFSRVRDPEKLRETVLDMRGKMQKFHKADQPVKQAPGGLIDLEFVVQYLVLRHSGTEYAKITNTLALLRKLFQTGDLDKAQVVLFKRAYQFYHRYIQQRVLLGHGNENRLKQLLAEVQTALTAIYATD